MIESIKNNWGTMVGYLSVAIVPLVFVDRVNRFVLLPELLVALIGILIGYLAWSHWGGRQSTSGSVFLAVGYLGVTVLSISSSHTPALSILPILTDLGYVSLLVLIVVGFTRQDIDRTVVGVAFVAGIVSVVGLLQYYGIGRHLIPTSGLPSATLGHRNIAAAYVAGALPLVLLVFHRTRHQGLTWFWAGWMALGLGFLIATRSRAGWLSVVVAGAVGLVIWFKGRSSRRKAGIDRSRVIPLALGSVLVAVIAASPADIEKREGEAMWHGKATFAQTIRSISEEGGDKGRLVLWDTTLKMIQNQPIIGTGPGHWRIAYPAYAEGRMIDANTAPHRPHNDFLTVWAESGPGALVLLLVLIAQSFRSAWRQAAGPDGPLAAAVAASIAACLCSGFFGFPREFFGASAPLWFGFGVLAWLQHSNKKPASPETVWIPRAGAVVSLLGLAFIVQMIQFDREAVAARIASERSDWAGVIAITDRMESEPAADELTYLLRGRAFGQAGNVQASIDAYRQGLSIHPHAGDLWLGLGVAQQAAGDHQAAQTSFETAIRYDPQDGRAYGNLGVLLAAGGRLKEAIAVLERAITAENTPAEVYGNLSNAYRRSGQVDRAVEVARTGMAMSESADLANALGNALTAQEDYTGAVATYEAGLLRAPGHVQLLYNLARAYEAERRAGDAIRTYQKVLSSLGDRFPEHRAFIERRITQLERGRE